MSGKSLAIKVLLSIQGCVAVFIVMSFILWETNPANWSVVDRGGAIFLCFPILAMIWENV